jgi:hypothetical protein
MADALGHLSKMTIQTCAGWTTAFPAGTGDWMPFDSEGMTEQYEEIEHNDLLGYGGREPSDHGNVNIVGSTIHELDYDNFDPLFEAAMGQVSTRTFAPTNDHVGKYYWIEFDKQVERWQYGACKANKIVIRGPENNGLVVMEVEHYGRLLIRDSDALVVGALTSSSKVLFKNLDFRIGDYVDALAGGDSVKISSFELTFERNFKKDDFTNNTTGIYCEEPVPGDWRNVTLSLEIPRYNTTNDLFADWKQAGTGLQASFTFTGTGGTLLISLPEMRIFSGFDMPIEGPAPLVQSGELVCYRNISNVPLAAITQELSITFA